MAIQDIISGAAQVINEIGGIARIHTNAPEALQELPAVLFVPRKGTIKWPRDPNKSTRTHDIPMSLFVNRGGDLPSADATLKPWLEKFVDQFEQNITLKGTAFNSGIIDYTYGKLEYAGVEYLGIAFTLRAVELKTTVFKG